MLQLPVGIVRKARLSGTSVRAEQVIGDVEGRVPVVVDDMISTGGTISAAMDARLGRGCASSLLVVAINGLFTGPAVERIRSLPIRRLIVSDSLPLAADLPFPCEVAGVADLLGDAIGQLHRAAPLDDLGR